MARVDFISLMQHKFLAGKEFNFDELIANPIVAYLSPYDIAMIKDIAQDPRLHTKPEKKEEYIKQILTPRGFGKLGSGNNRIAYKHFDDPSIILKISLSKSGLSDGFNEFKNQELLKPFCTKCFDITPCGTIGLFERVMPITSKEEFANVSSDIFELLDTITSRGLIMADIGSNSFRNYGLRNNFGPVLLDYPMIYKADINKLFCNAPLLTNPAMVCGGEIDFDAGFNKLICLKCGKEYFASELKKTSSENAHIISKGREDKREMTIEVYGRDGKLKRVVRRTTDQPESEYISADQEQKDDEIACGDRLIVEKHVRHIAEEVEQEETSEPEVEEAESEVDTTTDEEYESTEEEVEQEETSEPEVEEPNEESEVEYEKEVSVDIYSDGSYGFDGRRYVDEASADILVNRNAYCITSFKISDRSIDLSESPNRITVDNSVWVLKDFEEEKEIIKEKPVKEDEEDIEEAPKAAKFHKKMCAPYPANMSMNFDEDKYADEPDIGYSRKINSSLF